LPRKQRKLLTLEGYFFAAPCRDCHKPAENSISICFIVNTCDLSYHYPIHLPTCRPLMVSTQRLTSLAYNIVDGQKDTDKMSPNIRPYIVKYACCFLHVWFSFFLPWNSWF